MLVVVGTGALATLFAARLGRLTSVLMLGSWAEAIAAINRDGLRLGDAAAERVRVTATADPSQAAGVQFVLVLVKAWQTARAAGQIKSLLVPEGLALTLQNGLGNLETLAADLGAGRVALGTTTQGATLLGPGWVREGGAGPTHVAEHPSLRPLVELLRAAGFETHIHPPADLGSLVWDKLTVNCAINPLTALLRVPNGELLRRPEARAVMEAAAAEVAAVAAAKGIWLPFEDAAARAREVAGATACNRSSMFQDILRGAQTEVDAINGAVVREGQAAGVGTPVNETLWRLVKAINHE